MSSLQEQLAQVESEREHAKSAQKSLEQVLEETRAREKRLRLMSSQVAYLRDALTTKEDALHEEQSSSR